MAAHWQDESNNECLINNGNEDENKDENKEQILWSIQSVKHDRSALAAQKKVTKDNGQ